MSYPSSLDLAFGSEKSTADPQGRLSFGGGNSGFPKTEEELFALVEDGLAYQVSIDPIDSSSATVILDDQPFTDTLPDNLKGFMAIVLGDENTELIKIPYEINSSDPLEITVTGVSSDDSVYILLKQAVD